MGDNIDGKNGLLEKIHDLQVAQGIQLGRIDGRLDGVEQRLDRIDARLDIGSSTMHQQGEAIATQGIQVASHGRKISDLYQKFNVADVTGQTHIIAEKTRWNTLTVLGACLLGLCTLIGTGVGLQQCVGAKTAAKTHIDKR